MPVSSSRLNTLIRPGYSSRNVKTNKDFSSLSSSTQSSLQNVYNKECQRTNDI